MKTLAVLIQKIYGFLWIMKNLILKRMGWERLKSVSGVVGILDNNSLESISSLSNLSDAGALRIDSNKKLNSLAGLESCRC